MTSLNKSSHQTRSDWFLYSKLRRTCCSVHLMLKMLAFGYWFGDFGGFLELMLLKRIFLYIYYNSFNIYAKFFGLAVLVQIHIFTKLQVYFMSVNMSNHDTDSTKVSKIWTKMSFHQSNVLKSKGFNVLFCFWSANLYAGYAGTFN